MEYYCDIPENTIILATPEEMETLTDEEMNERFEEADRIIAKRRKNRERQRRYRQRKLAEGRAPSTIKISAETRRLLDDYIAWLGVDTPYDAAVRVCVKTAMDHLGVRSVILHEK